MNIILIAGMPASGKSTVARKIAEAFDYPILEKDAIKEELFDVIGFENYSEKRRHDKAATAVLLRVTEALLMGNASLVCVNNFKPEDQDKLQGILDRTGCKSVMVFFGGDADVFYQRYVKRDQLHLRHLGHVLQEHFPPHPGDSLEHDMSREEFREKFERLGMAEFRCKVPMINIDATRPEDIDVNALIEEIRTRLEQQ